MYHTLLLCPPHTTVDATTALYCSLVYVANSAPGKFWHEWMREGRKRGREGGREVWKIAVRANCCAQTQTVGGSRNSGMRKKASPRRLPRKCIAVGPLLGFTSTNSKESCIRVSLCQKKVKYKKIRMSFSELGSYYYSTFYERYSLWQPSLIINVIYSGTNFPLVTGLLGKQCRPS